MLNPFFDNAAKEKPGKTSFWQHTDCDTRKKANRQTFLAGCAYDYEALSSA